MQIEFTLLQFERENDVVQLQYQLNGHTYERTVTYAKVATPFGLAGWILQQPVQNVVTPGALGRYIATTRELQVDTELVQVIDAVYFMGGEMRITTTDWLGRYADAGYDALISGLAVQGLEGTAFLVELNLVGSQPAMNEKMLVEYVRNRQATGALIEVVIQEMGVLPEAVARPAAPTGLGAAAWGVWFSTPDTGVATVRWYVNGALKLRREHDLAANRSATLAELGAQAGDVVQVCVEAGGVVGWWARIELPSD